MEDGRTIQLLDGVDAAPLQDSSNTVDLNTAGASA